MGGGYLLHSGTRTARGVIKTELNPREARGRDLLLEMLPRWSLAGAGGRAPHVTPTVNARLGMQYGTGFNFGYGAIDTPGETGRSSASLSLKPRVAAGRRRSRRADGRAPPPGRGDGARALAGLKPRRRWRSSSCCPPRDAEVTEL